VSAWLRDWGNLLFTGVIAAATVFQWLVATRLARLNEKLDKERKRVDTFTEIVAAVGAPHLKIANLSPFGIWIERIDARVLRVTPEGQPRPAGPSTPNPIREVLPAYQVETFVFRFDRGETGFLPDVAQSYTVEVTACCDANGQEIATKPARAKITILQDSAGGLNVSIDRA
jgi:hypothetical protein